MDDTIAAIATPLGEGGLAVVRLSGPRALAIADACFVPAGKSSVRPSAAPTHTIHYGHVTRSGIVVDEVLVGIMRSPRSYTREDVVEISCHGGLLPAQGVLEAFVSAGARIAEPGEFSRRAFLNGRMDLAQAEAVADLIHARTELALRAASEQLAGSLSRRVNQVRDQLLNILAHVEAHIDFPEEDIAPDTRDQLLGHLCQASVAIDQLLATAREGRLLRQGIRAVIVGRPNAGKSSLLNCLLGHDRAIVSTIPGTTRDTIHETANVRGLPVVLIDTAGFREARDEIEQEGVRRSRQSLLQADLVLQVLDSSSPLSAEDENLLAESAGRPRLVVLNKSDLPCGLRLPAELAGECIPVSCLSGDGLDALKDAIKGKVWAGEIRAEMLEVMINARHQDALARAHAGLARCQDALSAGHTLELPAMDLRIAVNAVGEVVGKTATEDLLDRIFSQFCIGK